MTGRELIRLQATLHGLPRAEGERRAEALLEPGRPDRGRRPAGRHLLRRMRRRLDLASALVHEPRVLFLDEPTTGLDPVSRKAIWEEVQKLNRREGATVFLTTQYLEEADQLADRVGIISGGLIVAEGTPDELKAEVGKPHLEIAICDGEVERAREVVARLGKPLPSKDGHVLVELAAAATEVAPVVRALDEAGLAVESLDLVEPTLDDVFVAKTGRHLESTREDEPEADAEAVAADSADSSRASSPRSGAARSSRPSGARS